MADRPTPETADEVAGLAREAAEAIYEEAHHGDDDEVVAVLLPFFDRAVASERARREASDHALYLARKEIGELGVQVEALVDDRDAERARADKLEEELRKSSQFDVGLNAKILATEHALREAKDRYRVLFELARAVELGIDYEGNPEQAKRIDDMKNELDDKEPWL